MSKSAMRHHLMARKNPLSENGRIVPAGLQYLGGLEEMGKVKIPLGLVVAGGLLWMWATKDKKKANPRRRRNGTKKGMRRKTARKAYMKNPRRRRNASAHQKRAKKAMNLFHSGEARSLKAAWKMV